MMSAQRAMLVEDGLRCVVGFGGGPGQRARRVWESHVSQQKLVSGSPKLLRFARIRKDLNALYGDE